MKTDNACTCTATMPCEDGLAERPRYFPRQLITPDDMTLEQEYFRNKMRRHNRLLHGWGVVCGALVCPVLKSNGTSAGVPWKVVVQPGYILGPYGDEIIIDCNVCFDLRTRCVTGVTGEACGGAVDPWCSDVYVEPKTKDGKLYVAVRYKQVMSRPVRVQPVGCGCDDSQCEYSRWRDGYEICVLDHCPKSEDPPPLEFPKPGPTPTCPPCPPEPWVVLAEVQIDDQGVVQRINNCACRRLAVSFAHLWWQCNPMIPDIAVELTELEPGKEVTLTITGSNLHPNAEVSFGSGISVKSVKPVDGKALQVTVAVDKNAQPGPRSVVVKNPDCSTATLAGRISVAGTVAAPAPTAPSPPRSKKPGKPNP